MTWEQTLPQLLLDKGTRLYELFGINGYAWDFAMMDDIFAVIREQGFLVHGGDVYRRHNGKLEQTYDSWSYEGSSVSDSIKKMQDYLAHYIERNGTDYAFVLVVGVPKTAMDSLYREPHFYNMTAIFDKPIVQGLATSSSDIKRLIHQATHYHGEWAQIYPTLTDLLGLLDAILRTHTTTQSISIIPFYRSAARGGFQEKMTIGAFYLECRDVVTQEEIANFPMECQYREQLHGDVSIVSEYMTEQDMRRSHFLCQTGDVNAFRKAILSYQHFLLERGIPQMMKWLTRFYGVTPEEQPYGYFCFKIQSE